MGSYPRSRRAFLAAVAGGALLWLLGDLDDSTGAVYGGGGSVPPAQPDTLRISTGETYTVGGSERYDGIEICPGSSLCLAPGEEIAIAEAL